MTLGVKYVSELKSCDLDFPKSQYMLVILCDCVFVCIYFNKFLLFFFSYSYLAGSINFQRTSSSYCPIFFRIIGLYDPISYPLYLWCNFFTLKSNFDLLNLVLTNCSTHFYKAFFNIFLDSEHYKDYLDSVLRGPISITLRNRLQCHVIRDAAKNEIEIEDPILVLNEVTIDRGISSYLTNLECYCDNSFVTCVQGDGLILSTTSGSTAYSLAAGGSMVHPQVCSSVW